MGGFASLRRRITDPEILERRYPVILREYQLRPGSGGDGEYHGGDGVVREARHTSLIKHSALVQVPSGCSDVCSCPPRSRAGGDFRP